MLVVDLDTFTTSTITLTGANGIQQWVVDNGVLYVTSKTNGNIIKYVLATSTETSLNVANAPEGILSDWTYLYVMGSSGAKVIKIDIAWFTNIGNVTVGTTPFRWSISWDYLFTSNRWGSVSKVNLTTFTTIWTQVIGNNNFGISTDDDYVYLCSYTDFTIFRLAQSWEWENYIYLNDVEVYRRFWWRWQVSEWISNNEWIDVTDNKFDVKFSIASPWVSSSGLAIKAIF